MSSVSGGVGRTKETIELSCLGKLLLVCPHPHSLFFKVLQALVYAVHRANSHHFEGVWWTLPQLAGSLINLQCELSKNCSSVLCFLSALSSYCTSVCAPV